MPTVSQIGLKKSNTQVDIEKTRKTAHREAIARANLAILKQSIDRSAGFRSSQLMQDQKVIYRRFQAKLLTTQLNHARLQGDKEKMRETNSKLKNMRLLNDDEEYDFFRRLTSETARERATQLGRLVASVQDNVKNDHQKNNADNSDSGDEIGTDEEDVNLMSSRSALFMSNSSGSYNLTPSPTRQLSPPAPKPAIRRVPPQSARALNQTTETAIFENGSLKPSARNVTFQEKPAIVVRPETQSKTKRDGDDNSAPVERSKSCQPQLPAESPSVQDGGSTPTPTPIALPPVHPPPAYEPVEKASLPVRTTKITVATNKDEAIVAVAAANETTRIKSAAVTRGDRASVSPKPPANRPTTATNIFQKKTGPTKLERHEDWLRRRNYRTAVRDFCDSLFIQREPEPAPPPPPVIEPPPPKEEERPARRGRLPRDQEPVAPTPPPAPTPTPKPAILTAPISIFDYSELFLQDTIIKRKAPIFDLPVDPCELRREAGNPNVRNLTMMRVIYH